MKNKDNNNKNPDKGKPSNKTNQNDKKIDKSKINNVKETKHAANKEIKKDNKQEVEEKIKINNEKK